MSLDSEHINTKNHYENVDNLGTEMKRNTTRKIYTLLALFIVVVGGTIGYFRFRFSEVRHIEVRGNYFVSEQEVISSLNLTLPVHPDSLNWIELMNRVEALKYVNFADLSFVPPSDLVVTLTERSPVGLLMDESKRAYVDIDGQLMPLKNGKHKNVPLVFGFHWNSLEDTLASSSWQKMSLFLNDIAHHEVADLTLSEIVWSIEEGIIALSRENGVKIIFGQNYSSEKLRYWEAFVEQILPYEGIASLTEVDLRYHRQIITR